MDYLTRVGKALFKRWENANNLKDYSNFRIGLSAAASWSWGVSLMVGMGLMFIFGIKPAVIWMIGNITAIPLLGFLYRYVPIVRRWPRFLPMILLFLMLEYCVIVFNLQGILAGMGGQIKGIKTYVFHFVVFGHEIPHLYIVMLIGLFVVWYIRKGGLRLSVLTDVGQYTTQLIAVIVLVVTGYIVGLGYTPEQLAIGSSEYLTHLNNWTGPQWLHDFIYVNGGNRLLEWELVKDGVPVGMNWAKHYFFGIAVGVVGTGHHWQRFSAIDEKNVFRASLWGGSLFAIYMFFVVLCCLFFQVNVVLGAFLLITMLALGVSSIDSGVAGLEYLFGMYNIKQIYATIAAVIFVFSWPLVHEWGLTKQWETMADIRLWVLSFMAASTIVYAILNSILPNKKILKSIEKFFIKIKIMRNE